QVVQRVALRGDELNVTAQRVKAEYELLKVDDPIATQQEQLNRLMGRSISAPLDIDTASIVESDVVSLEDAYAEALASRPELRLARVQPHKAQLQRRLGRRELWPACE